MTYSLYNTSSLSLYWFNSCPIIDHDRKHQKYLTSDFFSTGQGVMNTGLGPCSPAPVEVSAGGGAEVPGAGPHVAR